MVYIPGRGSTGWVPGEIARLAHEHAIYNDSSGTIGVHFRGGGRIRLYNYNANASGAYQAGRLTFSESGYQVWTREYSRPGGDPTRIPALRIEDVVSGNPLPLGAYQVVFEMREGTRFTEIPVLVANMTEAVKQFHADAGTTNVRNQVAVDVTYVSATRVITYTARGQDVSVNSVKSLRWE